MQRVNVETTEEHLFLRPDTKIEPLSYRWYVWGHLVSPVQRALNLAFRHMPMLRSFVANAGVHEAAARNPRLIGGSFLELTQRDVQSVHALLQRTMQQGQHALRFAEDLIRFDRHLQQNETGFSLDSLYETLPATLAGLVELTYDLNHHPSLRIVEELAFLDDLAAPSAQEIAFSCVRDEKRNFFLNTPRLDSTERTVIPLAFASEAFDLISASRIRAVPFSALADALGVAGDTCARVRAFFDGRSPPRDAPGYAGDGVRLRYFGHACVLIQSASVSVLVDPFPSWDIDESDQRLTFHDLPDHIDYVFLTHNHQDHFSVETLLQLRNRVGTILVPRNNVNSLADPSMKLALKAIGHERVVVMDPMDRLPIPGGHLLSLPFYGEHADLSITSKHGLHAELLGRSFLFLADSDCKDRALYRRISAQIGKVDHLFIGMECDGAPLTWLYGPYMTHPVTRKDDESRRLSGSNAAHAWGIVEELKCSRVYVYAMGLEPWLRFVAGLRYTPQSKQITESDEFISRCLNAGIPAERLCGSRTMTL